MKSVLAMRTNTSTQAPQITIAVAQQIFRSWPMAWPLFLTACMLCIILRDAVSAAFCIGWLGVSAVHSLLRFLRWKWLRWREFDIDFSHRIMREQLLMVTVAGVIWSFALGYLIQHGTSAQQLIVVVVMEGLVVGAMFNYAYHLPSFLLFLGCVAAPVAGVLMLQLEGSAQWVGGGVMLFGVSMTAMARNFNRMVLETLALRFENLALVASLQEQKKAAEEANLAKSRFLAASSHDLRQPMHAFGLYLGALSALHLPDKAHVLTGKLYQCLQSMDNLFRGLLDISQLDAGAVQAQPRVFDLAAVLESLRVEYEPQAVAKGLRLRIARCNVFVYGDPALVQRIVRNLLSNAVRYTDKGKVLLGCRCEAKRVLVAVYDTGVGIAAQDHSRIFEEFLQLHNPQRDQNQGLGLGLSIVNRLAGFLNLPMLVRSVPGRGSVFGVFLPRAQATQFTDYPPVSPVPVVVNGLAGLYVVVIDNEVSIQDAARLVLEGWGCQVVVAGSGAQVLQQLRDSSRRPDVLLCDLRLGDGMDGVQVIQALRQEFNHDIAALLLTGDTDPQRLIELQRSGLPVLHKPLDAQRLHQAMGAVLGQR